MKTHVEESTGWMVEEEFKMPMNKRKSKEIS